jgi:hypothetical protein
MLIALSVGSFIRYLMTLYQLLIIIVAAWDEMMTTAKGEEEGIREETLWRV